jgi:DNA-binding response OmpR family regulator
MPPLVSNWLTGKGFPSVALGDAAQIESMTLRTLPALLLVDGNGDSSHGLALCKAPKAAPYSAIVPIAFLEDAHVEKRIHDAFHAGADEVLTPVFDPEEQRAGREGLMGRT